MATPKKTSSKTPEKPSDAPLTEVGRTDAARILQCSLATVKRWEREKLLTPRIDADGQHWFVISELEALRNERAGMAGPETEAVISALDNSQLLAKASTQNIERILRTVLDPSESLLQLFKATNAELREELIKTRGELWELLTKMQEILKAQRQEDIEQYRIQLSDRRKEQAIGLLKQAVPLLIAQAGGNKQLGQLLSFVQSLHGDQLRILVGSGLLTAEQIQALSMVLSEDQRQTLAQPESASDGETPGESTADA